MQPRTDKTAALEAAFNRLVKEWHREADFYSFSDQRAAHWAYRKIIDMGEPILPLIFREMERDGGNDWRHALEIITGMNPVTEEMWGKRGAAKEAWMNWAKGKGYQW